MADDQRAALVDQKIAELRQCLGVVLPIGVHRYHSVKSTSLGFAKTMFKGSVVS